MSLSTFVAVALSSFVFFFFFNDTATTEIYTLSLHDALPISRGLFHRAVLQSGGFEPFAFVPSRRVQRDRKSTRLNSSHDQISYAVFCLKKKKKQQLILPIQDQPEYVASTLYCHPAPTPCPR